MSNWKFTTIHHPARIEMGLSANEYCVFDIYYQSQTSPEYTVDGWAKNSYSELSKFLGLSKGAVFGIVDRGVKNGFLEVNPADPTLKRTTQKWYKKAYQQSNKSKFRSENERSENERSENERQDSEIVQKMNGSVQKMNANKDKLKISNRKINKEKERAREETPPQPEKKETKLKAKKISSKKVAAKKVSERPAHELDAHLTEEIPDFDDGPEWTTVAREMADYFNGPGATQWEFMCNAAGGYVDPMIITTAWAGKNCDSPYLLSNWKKQTGKLTNWIANNLRTGKAEEAKIKSLNNGKRKEGPVTPIEQRERVVRQLIAEGFL